MAFSIDPLHRWDVSPAEAKDLQNELRRRVKLSDDFGKVEKVAGLDVGFEDGGNITRAAAVVLSFPDLEMLDQAVSRSDTHFPYVPGLLSFREVPALLEAIKKLTVRPDLILCDGQGYAHPRRFGLACHLGLVTDIPTLGAAKSRLIGTHEEPGNTKGERTALMDSDEVIGAVLRTRSGVSPLYISAGHRIGLESACRFVLACCPRYRLPETTRQAHNLASN